MKNMSSALEQMIDNLVAEHGNDTALIILNAFVDQTTQDLATLNDITDIYSDEFARSAHRIASAAGMLNLVELRNQALRVEEAPTNPLQLELKSTIKQLLDMMRTLIATDSTSKN